MPAKKQLKRRAEAGLIRTVAATARLLPRPLGHRIFAGLGALAGRILTRDRERAVANLGIAFPDAPEMVRRAMVRAMFRTLGRNAFDFLNLEGAGLERMERWVERVEGLETFQSAFGRGKGLIVVTGHIGCWELMPAYFAARGWPVSVVARRMRNAWADTRLREIRSSNGARTLDRDSSPRAMLRVLKAGEVLGVLIDQHTSVSGTYVPFFDRPAFTPTGVARLAMMTGAPIVPMGVFMTPQGRHVIRVLDPIDPPVGMVGRDEAVTELTARCSLAVEELIRTDPKQWVWFHHRWREPRAEEAGHAAHH